MYVPQGPYMPLLIRGLLDRVMYQVGLPETFIGCVKILKSWSAKHIVGLHATVDNLQFTDIAR